MSPYESLIDPTEFGIVADYLRTDSPIEFLLHVKSEAMLATLAGELDLERLRPGVAPWECSRAVDGGLRDGSLLVSARAPLQLPDRKQAVDPGGIPRRAGCRVIYFPPFYLVHTPGLFEGTLHRQSLANRSALEPTPPSVRLKR